MHGLHDDVRLRIRACRTLPTLPTVALQILDLCQQPETSVREIAALIRQDPALTAKVLRTVNSSMYGFRSQVATIDHAAALLGLNALRSIALSFSLVRGLRRSKGPSFDHQRYWKRSIQAAVSARVLAQTLDLPEEEMFLASLLQDIGMLVLDEALPEYGGLAAKAGEEHDRLARMELEAFGADHAAISAWLLANWNLPDPQLRAVACSHDPMSGTDRLVRPKAACCVALAALIADIWIAEDPQEASRKARIKATAWLDLNGADFGAVVEQVAKVLPETAGLFDVDLGSPRAIHGILMEAKEALMLLSLQVGSQGPAESAGSSSPKSNLGERVPQDPLTGIFKRVHLEELLTEAFQNASRNRTPISVVFANIDHLRQVNDIWGFEAGDHLLLSTAHILAREGGSRENVARYNGQDLFLVLPGANTSLAAEIAERSRAAVAAKAYPVSDRESVRISISLGHATHMDGVVFENTGELLEAARHALRAAKQEGRNRVNAYLPRETYPSIPDPDP